MSDLKWCSCKEHQTSDFAQLTNCYSRSFIPEAWQLEYLTLDWNETGRKLYLTGHCHRCGGFMRAGTSISAGHTSEMLLAHIYQTQRHYRPFDFQDDCGVYYGACAPRCQWYRQQDELSKAEQMEQFTAMFHEQDQTYARSWAKQHIPEPPLHRRSASELFNAVKESVIRRGYWPNQSSFIYFDVPPPEWSPPALCLDRDLEFRTELSFNAMKDRIVIRCLLHDNSAISDTPDTCIGAVLSSCTDMDACLIMGMLAGAFQKCGIDLLAAEQNRAANLNQEDATCGTRN